MSVHVPFLDLDGRVRYLYERDYFPDGTLTDAHRVQLEKLNFHYFLGYARNYRMLVGQGRVQRSEKNPDDVFALIERDHQVSRLLYGGLRQAEWLLRNLVVKRYCENFDSAGSFLREEQYLEVGNDSRGEMVREVLTHIVRYGEPYVDVQIAAAAQRAGETRPKRYEAALHGRCVTYASGLPLWSVVDSFSFGLLSRFITQCDPRGNGVLPVWKEVARDLEIPAAIFPTNLQALAVLRNLVAHHTRLWMRPTTNSPRKPDLFERRLRDTDNKAMRVSFLNLALFQGRSERNQFADQVDSLVSADDVYYYGVTRVHRPTDADRTTAPSPKGRSFA